MTVANDAPGNARGLPPALHTAQATIHIPEVQKMLRTLTENKARKRGQASNSRFPGGTRAVLWHPGPACALTLCS